MKNHVVYLVVNTVNGKRYVGMTSRGLAARKSSHISRANNGDNGCFRFYAAIRKYGNAAFVWCKLASYKSRLDAFAGEKRFIALLEPEYNVTKGGLGTSGVKSWNRKKIICLETGDVYETVTAAADAIGTGSGDVSASIKRTKGRVTVKGLHFVEYVRDLSSTERESLLRELKENIVLSRRRVKSRKGWASIEDGRDKTGRRATGPMTISRPVICHDSGEIFSSASEAAFKHDVARSSLIELCLGKNGRKTVGGKRFSYYEAQL